MEGGESSDAAMETERVEMEFVSDKDGCRFPMWRVGDLYLPIDYVDPATRLRAISELQSKEGDLMICSFPKTGTNWVFEMVKMLRSGSTAVRVTWDVWLGYVASLDEVRRQPEPRYLITHLPPARLPRQVLENGKTLLMCRDPRDSAVSLYHYMVKLRKVHKYTGTWDAFIHLYMEEKVMYSSFFDYYRGWEKLMKNHPEYKIHLIHYEDLHKKGLEALQTICEFLEIKRTDAFLQQVLSRCQIRPLKAELEAHPLTQDVIAQETDDKTYPYLRKGIVGDWKNYFTVAQSEAFRKLMDDAFSDTVFSHHWQL